MNKACSMPYNDQPVKTPKIPTHMKNKTLYLNDLYFLTNIRKMVGRLKIETFSTSA